MLEEKQIIVPPKVVEGEVVKPVTTWEDVKKTWSEAWGEIKTAVEKSKLEKVCKNCKHWGKNEMVVELADKYKHYGACDLTAGRMGDGPFQEDVKAFAVDREDYYAELLTAPDFGCNQFELKEFEK